MTPASPWPGPRARFALLFAMYLVRALPGAWAVWPIAEAGLPPLDVLFEPGGLQLLEALRVGRSAWAEVLPRAVLAMLVSSFFGLWPIAAWLHALCLRAKPTLSRFLSTSLRLFGSLALLGVMVLVGQLALGLGTFIALAALPGLLDERSALLALLLVGGIALLAFVFVGVTHDLARAHLVSHDARAWPSLRKGFAAMGAAPLFAWAWRSLTGLLLVGSTAWLTAELGSASTLASMSALLCQQLALFGLVALRASFLAFALRRVGATSRASAGPWAVEKA